MEWKFEKYSKGSVRRDSASDKFFKETAGSEALIREFVQNSLDAGEIDPVTVIVKEKNLGQKTCNPFLSNLHQHLKDCNIQIEDQLNIRFVVLEDFNTKGLEGEHLESFFHKDNITDKKKGGGSHGIGKAVFYSSSKINTFFGYSLYGNNENVFKGRAVLKSHKDYRPDGVLNITSVTDRNNTKFINKLFCRKSGKKGLSVAIPYCHEEITVDRLKEHCYSQFYMPIINEKLRFDFGNESIDNQTLIQNSLIESLSQKIILAMEYKTAPDNNIKKFNIIEKDIKEKKYPNLDKSIIKNQTGPIYLQFKIEIPVKQGDKKYGQADLLIQKRTEDKEQNIDCWRDNLLISKALGYSGRDREYTALLIIKDNHLSSLLRKLEDPGHTSWQTKNLDSEVKNKYKNIPKLIKFIKKLPSEMIRQLKYQPGVRDSSFFADYFPDLSDEGKETEIGKGKGYRENFDNIDLEPNFLDFYFKKHKNNDGFTLKLKNKENPPDKTKITIAYGTNKGDAFKNYDKNDFILNANNVTCDEGEIKFFEEKNNCVECVIKNENFRVSFNGFDKDRELKINITT